MKLNTKNTSIFAILMVGAFLTGSFATADVSQETQLSEQKALMYGHVTATVYDADGNVKQYAQSDNKIVNNGLDMLVINTFSPSSAWTGGIGTAFGNVTHMQLGDGATELGPTANTISAIASCNPDTFTGDSGGAGAVPNSNSTSFTLSATFTTAGDGAGCATTIREAGLFDGSSGSGTDDMFAQNAFASPVPLTTNDQLDVDWTFTFSDT